MSIVSSFFPGRVRLRSPFLRDRELRTALINALEEIGFNGSYTVNEQTGSVLVEYDPAIITPPVIEALRPMVKEVTPLRTRLEYYSGKDREFLLNQIERLKTEARMRLEKNG